MKTCLVCGASATVFVREVPGYAGGMHGVFGCAECASQQAVEQPIPANLYEWIYREAPRLSGYRRYWELAQSVKRASDPWAVLTASEDMYWAVGQALKSLPRGARVLEVGSGLGYLTHALRSAGYDACGVDLSAQAVENATRTFGPWYRVEDALAPANPNEERWDAVVLTEVLEHLDDPTGFLAGLRSRLKPNGILLVTTPNRSYAPEWAVWTTELPPVHRTWISEKGAMQLAERTGYRAELVDFSAFSRTYFHEWWLARKGPSLGSPAFDEKGNLLRTAPFQERVKKAVLEGVTWIPGVQAVFRALWNRLPNRPPLRQRPTLALVLRPAGGEAGGE